MRELQLRRRATGQPKLSHRPPLPGLGFHTSMTYVDRRCRDVTDVKAEIAAGIESLPITAPMRREPYVGISIRVDGQRACRRAGALRRNHLWLCLVSRRRSRTA